MVRVDTEEEIGEGRLLTIDDEAEIPVESGKQKNGQDESQEVTLLKEHGHLIKCLK